MFKIVSNNTCQLLETVLIGYLYFIIFVISMTLKFILFYIILLFSEIYI